MRIIPGFSLGPIKKGIKKLMEIEDRAKALNREWMEALTKPMPHNCYHKSCSVAAKKRGKRNGMNVWLCEKHEDS